MKRRSAEAPEYTSSQGQPIGFPVDDWVATGPPPRLSMHGRTCIVEPLDAERHADALFDAFAEDRSEQNWTYLPYGPFRSRDAWRAWVLQQSESQDPLFHAVVDRHTSAALGVCSFLRVDVHNGVIEVGHINFAPRLQGTVMATEAMYLMMRRTFDDLGYRRYEWKCDALNKPSRRAATRLGFSYEGTFRQAAVYKGRNRDTAWYAIIDRDWPTLKKAYEVWLRPENFDDQRRQKTRLSDLTAQASRSTPEMNRRQESSA